MYFARSGRTQLLIDKLLNADSHLTICLKNIPGVCLNCVWVRDADTDMTVGMEVDMRRSLETGGTARGQGHLGKLFGWSGGRRRRAGRKCELKPSLWFLLAGMNEARQAVLGLIRLNNFKGSDVGTPPSCLVELRTLGPEPIRAGGKV